MRICYVVDAPYAGGAERYIAYLAAGIDRTRFESSVLLKAPPHDSSLDRWATALTREGIEVRRIPMNLPFRPTHAGHIQHALMKLKPKIVHVNAPGPYDGQMGLVAPLAKTAGASAVVVTEHLPMVGQLWKRAQVKRFGYRWVDRVITVCEANRPYLIGAQRVPERKVSVVRNGIPLDWADSVDRVSIKGQLRIPDGKVVVAFVGTVIPRKGLRTLVRALCNLPGLPWHLVVAGDGPDLELCREILRAANVEDRCTFLGEVAPNDVAGVMQACDLLALPSTMEGLPYVIIEAMASRLPVVASDVNGIPEMIDDGDTGFLVPPADAAAMAVSLAKLIEDKPLRSQMGERARARFEKDFTLSEQLRTTESIYEQLVTKR